MTNETLRLFVAIDLPETWREALSVVQQELAAQLETPRTARLRWVRPEGIHLTLKFLGNLPTLQLQHLQTVLAEAVPRPPNITLSLGDPGFFMFRGGGGREAVRVIWVGVRGATRELEALAAAVDAACATLGVKRERRGFTPHLTLARVPDETLIDAQDMRAAIARIETLECPPLTVRQVTLMRSHLGPGGARYERIAAFPPDA
jgi:2'-5' RNA ligase